MDLLSLPIIPENGLKPLWLKDKFQIGSEFTKVLHYSSTHAGWNDQLTSFHEESAGENHFIDLASRNHAIHQLNKHLLNKNGIILEVGCSSGFMLERIQKEFPDAIVMGSDIVYEPLKKLADRLNHVPLFRFDLTQCPLLDNSIDAVVMLNVLEHIKDHDIAIQQIYRILKPGGVAVIEVPAGPHLYDIYDKFMMHYRRYNLSNLTSLIKNQNFQILHQSHLGFFLYPGFWFVKKRNQKLKFKSDIVAQQEVKKEINNTKNNIFMNMLMKSELWLGKYVKYPYGIRCLVTCKK